MDTLFADMHIHTQHSDGTMSSEECVKYAQLVGLTAIAITDHDTTNGIPTAIKEGSKRGIEVIPGIELSAELKNSHEEEMHILGYFINWEDEHLQQKLKLFRQARGKRAVHILEKLKKLGIPINEKRLYEVAGIGAIGRLHFAKVMVEQNIVSQTQEAFQKYLGDNKPAYVPKLRLRPDEAIKMILKVGGIPVLAHPHFGHINKTVIKALVKEGLKGIEVWHTNHPHDVTEKFKKIAAAFGLLPTGGSDYHGIVDKNFAMIGSTKIPYAAVISLKKYKNNLDRSNCTLSFS